MAESKLRTPEFITLSGDHVGALSIQHFVYLCQTDKVQALVQILETEDLESAVVFCNTKDATGQVASALQQQGYEADWLNADLAQNEREKVMSRTRRASSNPGRDGRGRARHRHLAPGARRELRLPGVRRELLAPHEPHRPRGPHRDGHLADRAGRRRNLYLLRLTYKLSADRAAAAEALAS